MNQSTQGQSRRKAAGRGDRSSRSLLLAGALIGLSAPARAAGHAKGPDQARPRTAAVEWVRIPGGSFLMGSEKGNENERPVHRVRVRTFEMAKTLVTNRQYAACVDAGACVAAVFAPYFMKGPDHYLSDMDWNQAQAFCAWVQGRLPSEAEWEYAARSAGRAWEYPWGDEQATCQRAVINTGEDSCGNPAALPVCSRPRGNTKQGLCDMAGDAWEWVQDWYHPSYGGAPADGSAWEDPAGEFRVARGGAYNGDASRVRAAYREYYEPEGPCRTLRDPHCRSRINGFRCARDVATAASEPSGNNGL